MDDLHFLRPFWLLLILLWPLLYLTLSQRRLSDSGWARLIPERLLTPLIRQHGDSGKARKSPLTPVSLALVILAGALAGPAWREAPTPLKQPGDSLVIALDLSLSMLATDVEPDRLTRAKRKVRDILAVRKGSLTGLVVYSGDAHVVTPLTDDIKTIEGMLNVLDPVIMPAQGNRADLAVKQAKALLDQGAPGQGQILLITDKVADRYRAAIQDTLAESGYTLSTLTVGTPEGGPIPLARRGFIRDNGEIVITRAEPDELASLARSTGGTGQQLTLDDQDIRHLNLSPADQGDWREIGKERTIQRWQDDGYWLLWLAVPLVILGWRRGGLATALLLVLPALPQPASAMDWADLWQREDQRAPEMIQADPAAAAGQLENPGWRGSALYRAQQYEAAAEAFTAAPGARANYNRGNALARAGKFEEAIQAYDEALAENPALADARHNRALVKDLLEKQKQQQSGQGSDRQPGQQSSPSSGQNDPQQGSQDGAQNQQPQDDSQNGQDSPNNQSGQGQNRQPGHQGGEQETTPADRNEAQDSSGTDQQPRDSGQASGPAPISETPLTQGQEQWLRRVPDNPGGLLQRKFLQQYQERQTPSDEGDTPW
nr:VWA domain-containing protein [uncultured Marinobacter sp.]